MVPSTASFSSAQSLPSLLTTSTVTSSAASTSAFHDQNYFHSTGDTVSAVRMMEGGVPGLQYSIVHPNDQYQKILIIALQALSDTDPLHPHMYNPRLMDGETTLEISIPVSGVFSKDNLLVHKNATWMMEDVGYY